MSSGNGKGSKAHPIDVDDDYVIVTVTVSLRLFGDERQAEEAKGIIERDVRLGFGNAVLGVQHRTDKVAKKYVA